MTFDELDRIVRATPKPSERVTISEAHAATLEFSLSLGKSGWIAGWRFLDTESVFRWYGKTMVRRINPEDAVKQWHLDCIAREEEEAKIT